MKSASARHQASPTNARSPTPYDTCLEPVSRRHGQRAFPMKVSRRGGCRASGAATPSLNGLLASFASGSPHCEERSQGISTRTSVTSRQRTSRWGSPMPCSLNASRLLPRSGSGFRPPSHCGRPTARRPHRWRSRLLKSQERQVRSGCPAWPSKRMPLPRFIPTTGIYPNRCWMPGH